jgi:hypothetical protein
MPQLFAPKLIIWKGLITTTRTTIVGRHLSITPITVSMDPIIITMTKGLIITTKTNISRPSKESLGCVALPVCFFQLYNFHFFRSFQFCALL